jgi:hypothetical protein
MIEPIGHFQDNFSSRGFVLVTADLLRIYLDVAPDAVRLTATTAARALIRFIFCSFVGCKPRRE